MKEAQELFKKLFRYDGDLLVSTGDHEKRERQIKAIRAELVTYHRRDKKESTGWITLEFIEKILDDEYFTSVIQGSIRSEA